MLPLLVVLLLGLWEFGASPKTIALWGSPSSIVGIVWDLAWDGTLWPHASSTIGVALAGLALGTIAGILLAYGVFLRPRMGSSLVPIMSWLNALPRILLVPLFIATLGIGLRAKLAMVVAMTVFPVFFNVLNGLLSVDPRVIVNARLLGAGTWEIVRYIHLPLVADWLIASLRTALGFALIGAVISEYMGATSGLGYLVDIAYGLKRYDRAMAGLATIFLFVGILDLCVRTVERRWSYGFVGHQRAREVK